MPRIFQRGLLSAAKSKSEIFSVVGYRKLPWWGGEGEYSEHKKMFQLKFKGNFCPGHDGHRKLAGRRGGDGVVMHKQLLFKFFFCGNQLQGSQLGLKRRERTKSEGRKSKQDGEAIGGPSHGREIFAFPA